MRAPTSLVSSTITQSYCRTLVLLALVVASTIGSISALRAEDPPEGPPIELEFTFATAQHLGGDEWYIDGGVQAQDPAAVTIDFGGAGSGSVNPDEFGYFSTIVTGVEAGQEVTIDASDGTETAFESVTLEEGI